MPRRILRRNATDSQPSRSGPGECELCQRAVERYTIHHLVPKARGGKDGPRARLCPTCHKQLHAMFTETTLAEELNSLEALRSHPQVHRYLRWVRKQRGSNNFRVRRARDRG